MIVKGSTSLRRFCWLQVNCCYGHRHVAHFGASNGRNWPKVLIRLRSPYDCNQHVAGGRPGTPKISSWPKTTNDLYCHSTMQSFDPHFSQNSWPVALSWSQLRYSYQTPCATPTHQRSCCQPQTKTRLLPRRLQHAIKPATASYSDRSISAPLIGADGAKLSVPGCVAARPACGCAVVIRVWSLPAQWEHMVAVTPKGHEVLTA